MVARKGLDIFIVDKFPSGNFTESEIIKNEVAQYQIESDSVLMFLQDLGYEKSLNETITVSFVYDEAVIKILEDEHDHAGTIVKRIQLISNNFTPPDWGCNTYKALYHLLDEFINDLYQHIHLENNLYLWAFLIS